MLRQRLGKLPSPETRPPGLPSGNAADFVPGHTESGVERNMYNVRTESTVLCTYHCVYVLNKTGALSFLEKRDLSRGKTCRAYRQYGSANFVTIKIDTRPGGLSRHQRSKLKVDMMIIDGLQYSYLKKADTVENGHLHTTWINTSRDLSSRIFRQNHYYGVAVPQRGGWRMSWAKYSSRLNLAFSPSVPSLEPLVHGRAGVMVSVTDDEAGPGPCMTDGAGRIGVALMRDIIFPSYRGQAKGLPSRLPRSYLPSAVQVRYGAFKGMLQVDHTRNPKALVLTKSMQKYELLPENHSDFQNYVDILGVSKPQGSGTLNAQVLLLLEARGVPARVILDLLDEEIDRIKQEHESVDSLLHSIRTKDAETFSPNVLGRLLLAGMEVSEYHVQKLVHQRQQQMLDSLKAKMHIGVQHSRVFYMLPDLTGCLRPNEVYCYDSQSGNTILGDVCVCRNPVHHPSDIVCFQAVEGAPGQFGRDVILFSTQGRGGGRLSLPPAARLSGGDYDGDRAFICWDQRLVQPVKASAPRWESPPYYFPGYFDSSSEKVNIDEFERGHSDRGRSSSGDPVEKKLKSMVFEGGNSPLGFCSNEHKRTSRLLGAQHPAALDLARLCAKSVDAGKHGFDEEAIFREVKRVLQSLPGSIEGHASVLQRVEERVEDEKRAIERLEYDDFASPRFLNLAETWGAAAFEREAETTVREYNIALRNAIIDDSNSRADAVKKGFRQKFLAFQPREERNALALAYYKVCHDRVFLESRGASKPYQFCWEVVDDYLCYIYEESLRADEQESWDSLPYVVCKGVYNKGLHV